MSRCLIVPPLSLSFQDGHWVLIYADILTLGTLDKQFVLCWASVSPSAKWKIGVDVHWFWIPTRVSCLHCFSKCLTSAFWTLFVLTLAMISLSSWARCLQQDFHQCHGYQLYRLLFPILLAQSTVYYLQPNIFFLQDATLWQPEVKIKPFLEWVLSSTLPLPRAARLSKNSSRDTGLQGFHTLSMFMLPFSCHYRSSLRKGLHLSHSPLHPAPAAPPGT